MIRYKLIVPKLFTQQNLPTLQSSTPLLFINTPRILAFLPITHLVKVLMSLCTAANHFAKLCKLTARTRTVLARGDWARGGICNEPDVDAWAIAMLSASLTRHFFHADVAEKRDEIAHSPGARPIDVIGGELLGGVRGAVEETEGGGDERRNFAVCEAEEETLLVRPAVARCVVLFNMLKELGLCLEPRETKVR